MSYSRKGFLARGRSGTSITELMVAVVILSVGILGLFGAFRFISRSLHISRTQTIATNLAQEQIETLKNLTYYGLLVTTSAASDSRFTPNIVYDNGNSAPYASQTLVIGGMTFTRYTYVTLADMSSTGTVTGVSYTYPDTGMKQITVNVVWTDNGTTKKWTLTNLLENPAVNPLDATISGAVSIAGGGGALSGALVRVEQNPAWSATTDASGDYQFKVYHGTYSVRASSAGYYDSVSSSTVVARNGVGSFNLALTSIASGTVTGEAWFNKGLVVSQVVGATSTWVFTTGGGPWGTNNAEYLELFNPTTSQINLSPPSPNNNAANEYIQINASVGGNTVTDIMKNASSCNSGAGNGGVYVSTYVAAGGYYVMANFPRFMVNGVYVTADAYFNNNIGHITDCIADNSYGGVQIQLGNNNLGTVVDRICWNGNSSPPTPTWIAAFCNGNYIPTDSTCGLNGTTTVGTCASPLAAGNQLVRFSSPTVLGRTMFSGTYGSAYNSQSNASDFIYPVSCGTCTASLGINYSPFTTASPVVPILTGIPAVGADVAASDPYSASTQAVAASVTNSAPWSQSQIYAAYKVVGVTTGTYNVDITTYDSNDNVQFYNEIDNVAITQNVSVSAPNAATTPAWALANFSSILLSSTSSNGFLKGLITDANNNPISGINVQGGGGSKSTNSKGQYFMSSSSGTIDVIANLNSASNSAYVQSQAPVTVSPIATSTMNFILSLGATVTGYCTTGTTPVPNMVVAAILGGNQVAQATSNGTGVFTLANITTGTYTIAPVLEIGQDSNPNNVVLNIISTGTTSAGTFTVAGSYGSITGTVTNNSAAVTTGALIIASTSSISSTPPTITAASVPSQAPVYMISSKADGTFALPVRGSFTYFLSAYVPVVSNTGTVTISTKTYSGIVVGVNGTTTKNVVLP